MFGGKLISTLFFSKKIISFILRKKMSLLIVLIAWKNHICLISRKPYQMPDLTVKLKIQSLKKVNEIFENFPRMGKKSSNGISFPAMGHKKTP